MAFRASTGKIATVVALAGAAVLLAVVGRALPSFDADTIAVRVRASGAVGPLALIGLLVAQAVVAPLPSPPLLMAAGWILLAPMVGLVAFRLLWRAARGDRAPAARAPAAG
ncbi:MAG: hypothetical protein E6J56_17005 [Deltaproteobacteria bacterium]|nr:MAG: hypothetical protein E6J56_17005 [Deltaproteobacteria bacterium]